jgi:hypothetical protein
VRGGIGKLLADSGNSTISASDYVSHRMMHSDITDVPLVLVSARKSRGSGQWDKDDYDVRLGNGSGPVSAASCDTRRHLTVNRGFGR